jgi:caffeoyl-CoA O-methyltransferase
VTPKRDPKSFFLSPEIHEYLVEHGAPPDEHQRALIERTAALGPISMMQIAPEQGAFLQLLVSLLGVQRAIEVGTFTGYSALCIARGLAPGGRLLCCDVSEEWTTIGRDAWRRAGVDDRIELRLAPAIETLEALPDTADVDFAFIDADKGHYADYYEAVLSRLRPGGLIVVDNVLWSGRVVDASADDSDTAAIRAFNDRLAADRRVQAVMLPVADGLTLARKLA